MCIQVSVLLDNSSPGFDFLLLAVKLQEAHSSVVCLERAVVRRKLVFEFLNWYRREYRHDPPDYCFVLCLTF